MSEIIVIGIVLLVALAASVAAWLRRETVIIYPPFTGLLYKDGRFERLLPPGRYAWFDPFHRQRVVQLSTAELPVTLPEITILSKDQFSFRLYLAPVMIIVDARIFAETQPMIDPLRSYAPAVGVHPALQAIVASAALEVAGKHTLAEIMAAPATLMTEIQAKVADAVPGARIDRILVTAINLPPETRKMFTDVERSRMEAQSALERARGEQAALRVLANAARLVDDNPALANLRLLQAIENSKASTTIILGETAASPSGFALRSKATPA
ncbi:SPFH domain-containing protein [Sphingomonas sp. ASY06-1R]|uniref:SPFH domain-containing protein n=1 Tax=Sphingomonas sp. ASY06-1R TaxID=3445771 RepID=UPI003FA26506